MITQDLLDRIEENSIYKNRSSTEKTLNMNAQNPQNQSVEENSILTEKENLDNNVSKNQVEVKTEDHGFKHVNSKKTKASYVLSEDGKSVTRNGLKMKLIDSWFDGCWINFDRKVSKCIQAPALKVLPSKNPYLTESQQWEQLSKKPNLMIKILHYIFFVFSSVYTYFVAIEMTCPLLALSMYYQVYQITLWLFIVFLAANLFAQIPKRLFFRNRPWQAGHAAKLTSAATSSFPSRACFCSVMFPLSALVGLQYQGYFDDTQGMNYGVIIAICFLTGMLGSFSRIYLGAHYLSDCFIGMIHGFIVVFLCFLLFFVTEVHKHISYQKNHLSAMIVVPIVLFIINLLMNLKNFTFWEKGAAIFGGLSGNFYAYILYSHRYKLNHPIKSAFHQNWSTGRQVTSWVLCVLQLVVVTIGAKLQTKLQKKLGIFGSCIIYSAAFAVATLSVVITEVNF